MSGDSLFKHYPDEPSNPECANAYLILQNAHDSSSSFLKMFRETRSSRSARGTSTDEEQDLLRAMLTFATAGLDSMIKQLIRDALPKVIDLNQGAGEQFKRYIERRLKKDERVNFSFVADALGDLSPRQRLMDDLVASLTAGSLQSREELLKAAAFFDVPSKAVSRNHKDLDDVFEARNQIAHEMDVHFDQRNRSRRQRTIGATTKLTNEVFRVASVLLEEIDKRLSTDSSVSASS